MLHLLSFMRLFVVGLTTAVLSMLVSPWCALLSLSACFVLLLGLLVVSLNLTISRIIMRDVLHWLPVSQRIQFRISLWVLRCQLGCAPAYTCASSVAQPQVWLPAEIFFLHLVANSLSPLRVLQKMQLRAFSVVGPTTWN